MNENTGDSLNGQLDAVIAEYIAAVERDGPQDCDHWLARHPEIEAELRSYFDDHDHVMKWIDPEPSETVTHVPTTESFQTEAARECHYSPREEVKRGELLGGKYRVVASSMVAWVVSTWSLGKPTATTTRRVR